MAHSFVSALFHCVFSTKERRPVIVPEISQRLWPYMGGIARENKFKALGVGGTENHAHVVLSIPSTLQIAKAVQLIKGGSSKWIHETMTSSFEWQEGYGAFSLNVSILPETLRYVARQAEHHHKMTFEEEFLAFLERHGIDYDPKFVFG